MTVAAACFVDRENVLYDLRRAAATSSLSFKCKKEQKFFWQPSNSVWLNYFRVGSSYCQT